MDEKDAIEKAYDLTISLSEGFSDYSLWLLNKIPEKYVISFIWGTIIIGIIVRKNVDKTAGLLIMLPVIILIGLGTVVGLIYVIVLLLGGYSEFLRNKGIDKWTSRLIVLTSSFGLIVLSVMIRS